MDDERSLSWLNVTAAFTLVLVDISLSRVFDLGIAQSLLVASTRCIVQLSFMSFVLKSVFLSQNALATVFTVLVMLLLAANEVASTRIKRKPRHLLLYSALSLVVTIGPVAIYGSRFAMQSRPFWSPESFIPMIGMITGNTLSAVAIALNHVMKSLTDDKDKIELFICYGATRFEACLPLVREALKVALLPVINQMAVIGLISIPGMMTGSILAGAPVEQAAKMQMCIMFLITGCSALCTLLVIFVTLYWMIDGEHRIRLDRLDGANPWLSLVSSFLLQQWTQARTRLFPQSQRQQYIQLAASPSNA